MSWLPEALKYVGSGAVGAAASWGLSWLREHRRTLDAYRAPQREAIGEIVTGIHPFMLRELDMRTCLTEMLEQMRKLPQQADSGVPGDQLNAAMRAKGGEFRAAMAAMSSALLDVTRAFQVGTLTIIDAPCWEAMGDAAVELHNVGAVMQAGGATAMHTIEEFEEYARAIEGHAKELNRRVSALVRLANDRVSPADRRWNRWRRRRARKRLGRRYQQADVVDTSEAPQPHY